jgi:hypothetical protein
MRGLDPEEVHSLHMGTDREAVLALGDLRELLEEARKAEFYAGVLAEVFAMIDPLPTEAGVLSRIFNKVSWALDPLADHRSVAR